MYEFLFIGSPHPIYNFKDHKPVLHCFTKKETLAHMFIVFECSSQNSPDKKINTHTPDKTLSVADTLSRSPTKTELQLNQLKLKQLPQQVDFAILQNNTLTSSHYLIQHEEVLPHPKHDSHPIEMNPIVFISYK